MPRARHRPARGRRQPLRPQDFYNTISARACSAGAWMRLQTGSMALLDSGAESEDDVSAQDVWNYDYDNTAPGGNMYNAVVNGMRELRSTPTARPRRPRLASTWTRAPLPLGRIPYIEGCSSSCAPPTWPRPRGRPASTSTPAPTWRCGWRTWRPSRSARRACSTPSPASSESDKTCAPASAGAFLLSKKPRRSGAFPSLCRPRAFLGPFGVVGGDLIASALSRIRDRQARATYPSRILSAP